MPGEQGMKQRKGKVGIAARALVFCALLGLLAACDSTPPVPAPTPQVNENKPSYIKDVTALDDGNEGILLYLALADADGGTTSADGKAAVLITEDGAVSPIYSATLDIKKSDFRRLEEHLDSLPTDAIVYSAARIPYSSFDRKPILPMGRISVKLELSTGELLSKRENIFFHQD